MNSGNKKTLLLVEDEALLAVSEKMSLEKKGYSVITATSGEKAVSLFRTEEKIDLVLMDIDLGTGMDGTQAANLILEIRAVPVVFLSSHSEPDIVDSTDLIASYGYVVKSSGATVLDATIRMAFRLFEATAELEAEKENLRVHDERLELVNNSSRDCIYSYDAEGRFTSANRNLCLMLGRAENMIIGKTDKELGFPEKICRELDDLRRKVYSTGKTAEAGINAEGCDGSDRFYEVTLNPLHGRDGTIIGIGGNSRDVTQQENAEKAVLEAERKFRALFEMGPIGVAYHEMLFDEKGNPFDYRFLDANESYIELTGIDPRGKTAREAFPGIEKDPGDWIGTFGTVTKTGKTVRFEQYLQANDRWYDCVAYRYKSGHFVAAFLEKTVQKAAEKKLQESEAQYRRITAGITDYLYTVCIEDGKVTDTVHNEACVAVTGYSPRDFRNDPYLWYNMVVNEDRERVTENIAKVLEGGTPPPIELRIVCKDGSVKWISDTSIPHHDGNGKLISYDGVIKDITERKIAEEKLNGLLLEKELLLKEVHHRIKNNMNTIHSLLTLQAATVTDDAAFAALEDACSRVRSMMILYDKLYNSVDFVEIPVGRYLPPLIDEILSNFPNRQIVKTDKNIDDFILNVRKLQPLGIIINELLTNIMKYAFVGKQDGHISISATCTGDTVDIVIEDDGNGMPESVNFENSTGFGLVLVGGLTKQLEGTIRIERVKGTRIILEFKK